MSDAPLDGFKILGIIVVGIIGIWLLGVVLWPLLGLLIGLVWALAGLVAGLLHVVLFLGIIGGGVYALLAALGLVGD